MQPYDLANTSTDYVSYQQASPQVDPAACKPSQRARFLANHNAIRRPVGWLRYAVSYEGKAAPPYPLDDNCYVALIIDGTSRLVKQIRLAEADHLAAEMLEVESYDQPCLEGMPNT